jgi:DNA-3-methyladenine glycosylase II
MNLELAKQHLAQSDPILAQVIEQTGPPQLGREPQPWRALSSSIIGQQVSVHAARAIRGRFAALQPEHDFPTPDLYRVLTKMFACRWPVAQQSVGHSGFGRHINEGLIQFEKFEQMSDEEIIAALVPVRGIGRWTAEMFLIFSLGREDVLAVDDQGLRNAIKKLYALEEASTSTRMREIAEPWRPWRSVASWYLWRSLDNEPKIK